MSTRVWKAQWMVASFTEPDKEYKVSEALNGHWECSCWPWRKTRDENKCKHIPAVKRQRAGTMAGTQIDRLSGAKQVPTVIATGHVDEQWIIRQVRDMDASASTAAPVIRKGREI